MLHIFMCMIRNNLITHIVSRKSIAKFLFVYTSSAFLVLACSIYLYVLEEESTSLVYKSLLFDIFIVKLLLGNPVKKESVVIMLAFGLLEYSLRLTTLSGKVFRCFVPIDKILKPNLVAFVTCYWTLSLIYC